MLWSRCKALTQSDLNSSEYCRVLVAESDPDRYLATFFASRAVRPDLWALLAFNQEIAKTREVVTETTIGLMRLQWWRDTIDQLCRGGTVVGNPILSELGRVITTYRLTPEFFETLIYAREFDLEGVLPANLQGVEHYADYTHTSLLMLMARVCGAVVDVERVRYLAIAFALMGLVRAIPFHARQARCYMPQDLLVAAGVTEDQLYALRPVDGLAPVVKAVCELAREHLCRATDLDHMRVLRAMHVMTDLYLRQIEGVGYNIFSPKLAHPPAFMALRVAGKVLL